MFFVSGRPDRGTWTGGGWERLEQGPVVEKSSEGVGDVCPSMGIGHASFATFRVLKAQPFILFVTNR